jgi:hypothetical protein
MIKSKVVVTSVHDEVRAVQDAPRVGGVMGPPTAIPYFAYNGSDSLTAAAEAAIEMHAFGGTS